jgi:multicomponent K+:H+ antiporter subunit G
MTVPVTTVLLARVALFRRRTAGAADTPPTLSSRSEPAMAPKSAPLQEPARPAQQ